jgi:hypothetical protein
MEKDQKGSGLQILYNYFLIVLKQVKDYQAVRCILNYFANIFYCL